MFLTLFKKKKNSMFLTSFHSLVFLAPLYRAVFLTSFHSPIFLMLFRSQEFLTPFQTPVFLKSFNDPMFLTFNSPVFVHRVTSVFGTILQISASDAFILHSSISSITGQFCGCYTIMKPIVRLDLVCKLYSLFLKRFS